MKFPFRRSPPAEPLTVAQRVDRITRIAKAMAEQAIARRPEVGKLATDPELHLAIDSLGKLPDDQLAQFLDMLEAGVPKEFRHML